MTTMRTQTFAEVASFVRHNEVGRRACIETPFGRRLVYYADLTATGRYLHFVEAWMRRVRPFYANSHTAVSSTGRIMTQLREEARRVIRAAVHAHDDDLVMFVGAGATAAINKLVGLLGWRISEPLEREFGLSRAIPQDQRPVVLLGPYEHHSNELPWVESIAEVVEIGLDARGHIDTRDLQDKLERFAARPFKLGAFSAASNVTGLLSDVPAIARILHRGGAYACFDYAAAGPYVPIDMHASDAARIDALFVSPHKFIGGPNSSGLLVVNPALVRTRVPERPGGGTVAYVSAANRESIDYVGHLEEREEGGTPAIVSDLRAGTAFLVKQLFDADELLAHEIELARSAIARLSRHPKIRILGSVDADRLAIISFNIAGLHHDLVAGLLDHLFGIQNRAGCSCAGPYGHRLLGIDQEQSERFRRLVARGVEGIKPGWVRVSLPFFAAADDVEFVLSAIEFVAERGMDFVPMYRFEWKSGVWCHIDHPVPDVPPLVLTVDALLESAQCFAAGDHEAPMSDEQIRAARREYFEVAHACADEMKARWASRSLQWNRPTGDAEIDALRWFDYVEASSVGE